MSKNEYKSSQRGVKLTRLYNVSREQVFRAWTEAKYVSQWSGAEGFTVPVCEINPRTGGSIRMIMRSEVGIELPMTGLYQELISPSLISLAIIATDTEGLPRLDMLITATFAAKGKATELTVETTYVGIESVTTAMMEGMEANWKRNLDQLGELLKGMSTT